jgi:citrate synthase
MLDNIKDLIAIHEERITNSDEFISALMDDFDILTSFPDDAFVKYNVKRGLRNADGTGVMAGLTLIANVTGYIMQDGERTPCDGKLYYRGYDVEDLIKGFLLENRFGFEETAYLILFGALPTEERLKVFSALLGEWSELPQNFSQDMILNAPSRNIMNKLGRSVLALYSYDEKPESHDVKDELTKALRLIARAPMIVAHAYAVKRHVFDRESLYLHHTDPSLSFAENFLRAIRQDGSYTSAEAKLLDLCMVLHAEHGGGNNSAFACRALSSTGTDIYSSISAAVGSLKGPKHGGANEMVMQQFAEIKSNVKDWKDDGEIMSYLSKILNGKVGDGSKLIYGMGHAVYTLSDPRAVVLKKFARTVAQEKGRLDELELLESVERLAPIAMNDAGKDKVVSANVDFYSGLIYSFLGIPDELYTPMFAISRMVGWCAHRIEEVYNPRNRIMRPAYKSLSKREAYSPISERR